MFSKTKLLVIACNSLDTVLLKWPPAQATNSSNLLWKMFQLQLGVLLRATGAIPIAMSLGQFHSRSLSQSLILPARLIL